MNRSPNHTGRRTLAVAGALLLAAALAPRVLADEDEEEQQYLAPTVTGETGLFTIFTGQTLKKGGWSFGVYYNNWDRLVARPGFDLGEDWDYDFHRLSASVGYGITDRFELALMVPYEVFDGPGDGNQFGAVNGHLFAGDIDAKGLGNVRLGGKVRVVGEHDGANVLAVNLFLEAPTGDDKEGVATGDPGFGAGIAYTHKRFSVNASFRDPGDGDLLNVSPEIHLGVGYAHPVTDRFFWMSEVEGILYTDSDFAPDNNFDLASGVRIFLGEDSPWAFNAALRTDLAQLGDAQKFCPLGGLVGLTYFPRAKHEKKEEETHVTPQPTPPPPPKPEPPPPAPLQAAEIRVECDFRAGSARVDNICKARLDEVALKLKQSSALRATVTGYAPKAAGEQAKMRAENVKKFLVDRHKIDPSRITTAGAAEASDRVTIVLK